VEFLEFTNLYNDLNPLNWQREVNVYTAHNIWAFVINIT